MKVEIVTELLNYKAVDGVMVPFSIRQLVDGKPQGEVSYARCSSTCPAKSCSKCPNSSKRLRAQGSGLKRALTLSHLSPLSPEP